MSMSSLTASAEPTTWNMRCSGQGVTRYVNSLKECREGYVRFINSKTGQVDGSVDMYRVTHNIKRYETWAELNRACEAKQVCRIAGAAAGLYLTKKLKVVYTFLRAL